MFWFCRAETESCHVVETLCWGTETQLRRVTQVQAPEHIPWVSTPTNLSRTLAQVPAHLTAWNEDKSAALNWRVLRSKSLGVDAQQPQAGDLWVPLEKMSKVGRTQRLLPTQHILAQVPMLLFCTSRTPLGEDHWTICKSS